MPVTALVSTEILQPYQRAFLRNYVAQQIENQYDKDPGKLKTQLSTYANKNNFVENAFAAWREALIANIDQINEVIKTQIEKQQERYGNPIGKLEVGDVTTFARESLKGQCGNIIENAIETAIANKLDAPKSTLTLKKALARPPKPEPAVSAVPGAPIPPPEAAVPAGQAAVPAGQVPGEPPVEEDSDDDEPAPAAAAPAAPTPAAPRAVVPPRAANPPPRVQQGPSAAELAAAAAAAQAEADLQRLLRATAQSQEADERARQERIKAREAEQLAAVMRATSVPRGGSGSSAPMSEEDIIRASEEAERQRKERVKAEEERQLAEDLKRIAAIEQQSTPPSQQPHSVSPSTSERPEPSTSQAKLEEIKKAITTYVSKAAEEAAKHKLSSGTFYGRSNQVQKAATATKLNTLLNGINLSNSDALKGHLLLIRVCIDENRKATGHPLFHKNSILTKQLEALEKLVLQHLTHEQQLEAYIQYAEHIHAEQKTGFIGIKSDQKQKLAIAHNALKVFRSDASVELKIAELKKAIRENRKATGPTFLHGTGRLEPILEALLNQISPPTPKKKQTR